MNKLKNKNRKIKFNEHGFGLIEALLIIIALALVVGVGFYVYNSSKKTNQDNSSKVDDSAQKKEDKTDDKKPAEETDTQAKELITYDPDIEITQKSDVSKLEGASQSFKDFIASQVSDSPKIEEYCDHPSYVTVEKVYKNQFASGGAGGCGGTAQVWVKSDGVWTIALRSNAGWKCSDITKFSVPYQIVDLCYDDAWQTTANTL